jgi:hypothetical protein
MDVVPKDVASVERLYLGILEMIPRFKIDHVRQPFHPQPTALEKLARARQEKAGATLRPEEVKEFCDVYTQFPRNITVKFLDLKEPHLRLMTRAEKAATLHVGDVCLSSPADVRMLSKSASLKEKAKLIVSDEAELNRMVLLMTPGKGEEIEVRTSVSSEKGPALGNPGVSDKKSQLDMRHFLTTSTNVKLSE